MGKSVFRVRHNFNIFVTFFISGLWHGASWHYVIWGALHGVYQIVGSYVEPVQKRLCKVVHIDFNGIFYKTMQRIVTLLLIVITFIFFRAVDVPQALEILKKTLPGIWSRQSDQWGNAESRPEWGADVDSRHRDGHASDSGYSP